MAVKLNKCQVGAETLHLRFQLDKRGTVRSVCNISVVSVEIMNQKDDVNTMSWNAS